MRNVRWLGLRSCNFLNTDGLNQHGLLQLSERDRKKATSMLEKEVFQECGPEPEWRMELQRMLILNIKAEIQIMCKRDNKGLENLIRHRLKQLACER